MIAGLLVDVVGRSIGVSFLQSGLIGSNVGNVGSLIVIVMVAVAAHNPASGVNVYVNVPLVEVFMTAGFHVPVMDASLEGDIGRSSGTLPLQ